MDFRDLINPVWKGFSLNGPAKAGQLQADPNFVFVVENVSFSMPFSDDLVNLNYLRTDSY